MPGLREDVDTREWKVSDWSSARYRNSMFLIGWIAFFAVAISANLAPINWYMLAPMLLIASLGGAFQIVWLIRISIWLDKQKTTKSAP